MANNRPVRFVGAWRRHAPLLPLLVVLAFANVGCDAPAAQSSSTIVAPSPISTIEPTATPTRDPQAATAIPEIDPDIATKIAILSQITPYPTITPSAPYTVTYNNPLVFDFLDEGHGWLVVDNGSEVTRNDDYGWSTVARLKTLLSTTDGGITWQSVYTSTGILDGLSFTSPTTSWMTMSDALFATHNGGATWQLSNNFLDSHYSKVWDVQFVDADNGWLRWWQPKKQVNGVLHTSDGGSTWAQYDAPCNGDFPSGPFSFVSPDSGWIICVSEPGGPQWKTLYHSDDGGQDWTLIADTAFDPNHKTGTIDTGGLVGELAFVDNNFGWLGTGKGPDRGTSVTTDSGLTWNYGSVVPPDSSGERLLKFRLLSPTLGYATAYKSDAREPMHSEYTYIFSKTTDSGATWTQLYPIP